MHHPDLTIECLKGEPDERSYEELINIVSHYFPKPDAIKNILAYHIADSDAIILARLQGRIVGVSLASQYRRMTPFYHKPLPVVFQRALFVDPDIIYRGLGKRLLVASLRNLLGWFWFMKRFVFVCRTQNPAVARMMNNFSVMYPQPDATIPGNIREFAESMLPVLHATGMDEEGRLVGSLDEFKDLDQTDIWNKYFNKRHDKFEKQMLNLVYRNVQQRIINTGEFLFMTAYAKPLTFLRFAFH